MTSEISFLIELLLKHRMPLVTKEIIATRIKEVEARVPFVPAQGIVNTVPKMEKIYAGPPQAASMQAIMDRNPDLVVVPKPVEVVAQTPATIAALNSREQAIAASMAGKVDKETGRPKKF